MSVLDREALEQSPLADLHAIASELSIDSYRRLRREPLIDAILARQEGADGSVGAEEAAAEEASAEGTPGEEAPAEETPGATAQAPPPTRTRRRRTRARAPSAEAVEPSAPTEPEVAEPAADTTSERTRFEAAPARFPDAPLLVGADDAALAAIEALAPLGLGSRVTIVGPARAGKTELLRRIAVAIGGREELQAILVLVGVRPEEIGEWQAGPLAPVQALSFAAPTSALDRAVYGVIDEVRTVALGGGDAIVLLDTLDSLHDHAARRALATARNLAEGGSVTVIATASEPLGGETTVVALNPLLTDAQDFPALDPRLSGTLRAELLVGEQGAATIAHQRSQRLAAIAR